MKKLGIVAGLGVAATRFYRALAPRAAVEVVPTGTFLFGDDATKYKLIKDVVCSLKDRGCTHFTVGCFSYQEEGNAVIRDLNLEVAVITPPNQKEPK